MTIPAITDLKQLQAFLDKVEAQLTQYQEESSELGFQRYLDKQPNPRIAELAAERAKIMLNPQMRALIDHWYPICTAPLLKRRLQLWQRALVAGQVMSDPQVRDLTRDLDQRIVSHLYPYRDQRISLGDIRNIIRFDRDAANRREAWLSYGELSRQLAPDLLQLMKLRNAIAKDLGFKTYVDLILQHNELSKEKVVGILQELLDQSQERYDEVLQKGAQALGLEKIEPWDVQICLEAGESIPTSYFPKAGIKDAVSAWAKKMGIDMDVRGIEMVFVDIPYNGLCMGIRKGTTKILGNPQDGFGYYKTMFHELGHALHGEMNDVSTLMLKRDSGIFGEGLAEVFGYVASSPDWLATRKLPEEVMATASKALLGPMFHYLRQRTAYCLFEYALYSNLDADPDALMAEWESRVLGCSYDASPRWAANAWFISNPVYWQNYVLADVVASQIHRHLNKAFGPLAASKAAFDFVISHYIAPGAVTSWLEKIESATGEPLNAKALIADLNR